MVKQTDSLPFWYHRDRLNSITDSMKCITSNASQTIMTHPTRLTGTQTICVSIDLLQFSAQAREQLAT